MNETAEAWIKIFKENNIECDIDPTMLQSMIMSMVRRIMNEVVDVANDNNITIYNMTHDTIHFDHNKIHILKQKYKKRYNRKLSNSFIIKGAFLTVN